MEITMEGYQDIKAVLQLANIIYDYIQPEDDDIGWYAYSARTPEPESGAYIQRWEHEDGIITYTIYDKKDGNFIKDIAIIDFPYQISKIKTTK